jgi:hypothetical protein
LGTELIDCIDGIDYPFAENPIEGNLLENLKLNTKKLEFYLQKTLIKNENDLNIFISNYLSNEDYGPNTKLNVSVSLGL